MGCKIVSKLEKKAVSKLVEHQKCTIHNHIAVCAHYHTTINNTPSALFVFSLSPVP